MTINDAISKLRRYIFSDAPRAQQKQNKALKPGVLREPPRTVKGMQYRVDRLKCLGNAVVPAQFYPIFAAIAGIERGTL